jgi:hypothetical protein
MRIDLARLLGPLVAALVLVLILQQTLGALRVAGVWGLRHTLAVPAAASPFARIEGMLARAASDTTAVARDPFAFGHAPAPVLARRPASPKPAPVPAAPAQPVLTSIVWLESNPSATLRWNGRDYPVQTNTLFDEFRVQSITRDQVTLVRGAEILVLQLPKKGD